MSINSNPQIDIVEVQNFVFDFVTQLNAVCAKQNWAYKNENGWIMLGLTSNQQKTIVKTMFEDIVQRRTFETSKKVYQSVLEDMKGVVLREVKSHTEKPYGFDRDSFYDVNFVKDYLSNTSNQKHSLFEQMDALSTEFLSVTVASTKNSNRRVSVDIDVNHKELQSEASDRSATNESETNPSLTRKRRPS